MKGIILAGGTGSRMGELCLVTNKHLLPVGERPMILHLVSKLVDAGVDNIMVISGTEHMGHIVSLLGSGDKYGCNLTFRIQDKPDGIAGALRLCRNFVGSDDCVVLLGDNMFEDDLSLYIEGFRSSKAGCRLVLKEVPDIQRFAEAILENDVIVKVVEKPQDPVGNLCVVGIYVYDSSVFDVVDDVDRSGRGEYEITTVNDHYVKRGLVEHRNMRGWWSDAGTFESYYAANKLVRGEE